MIHSITSPTLSSFKPVQFRPGFNVILSDRSPNASAGHTTNSTGKTSLFQIIHFLLGADCPSDSLLRHPELVEHRFRGVFSFGRVECVIERGGTQPANIYLPDGQQWSADLPIKQDKKLGVDYISNDNWKQYLGEIMFHLPGSSANQSSKQSYSLSFRSLISYFIRRHPGGYDSPLAHFAMQQPWDRQQHLSYLFGLDWELARSFQLLRDEEKALKGLRKVARGETMGAVVGSTADLRSKLSVAQGKANKLQEALREFRVHEAYRELEQEVAQIKNKMREISHESVSLRAKLDYLEQAQSSEAVSVPSHLERTYAMIGIELPGLAHKQLKDVQAFYNSIVDNRRYHLAEEIRQVTDQVRSTEKTLAELDAKQQENMSILESHGALEDLISLQQRYAKLETEVATLQERFKAAEILEGRTTELKIDRVKLNRRLQQDFHEREAVLDEAIRLVAGIIDKLYDEREGKLNVEATENGPKFDVSIPGDRGGGISNMEIFCLDLAMFKLNARRSRGPGFLAHDSHLFDGVDGRQVARALELGADAVMGTELQYIVTLSSEVFEGLSLPENLGPSKAWCPVHLTDETETGGLFGFRFD